MVTVFAALCLEIDEHARKVRTASYMPTIIQSIINQGSYICNNNVESAYIHNVLHIQTVVHECKTKSYSKFSLRHTSRTTLTH